MARPSSNGGADVALQALPLLKLLARRGKNAGPVTADAGLGQSPVTDGQPAALVRSGVDAGWIERTCQGLALTASGKALLRRLRSAVDCEHTGLGTSTLQAEAQGVAPTPLRNPEESPLDWLRRRTDAVTGQPMLNDEQFAAGERLRRDFYLAQMTPRVTASWDGIAQSRSERRGAPGAFIEMSNTVLAAHERVVRALVAAGPPYIDLLIDVLGHLKGLEEVERTRQFPARSAKRFLQQALTRLAHHYGITAAPNVERDVRLRLQHWGADDYRPTITRPE